MSVNGREYRTAVYVFGIVLLSVLLASCGSLPPLETESDTTEEGVIQLPPRQAPVAGGSDTDEAASAVDQLIAQANEAMAEQYLGKASALVERALRLAPRDPRAYFSLAQIRHQQGQTQQVRPLLAKARTLAAGNQVLAAAITRFEQSLAY